MATQIYRVRDPGGAIREIEGPAGATDDQVIAKAKELFAPPIAAAPAISSEIPAARQERGFFGSVGAPIQALSEGIIKGGGNIMFGGQQLVGKGLQAVGATETGQSLITDAQRRQAESQARVAPFKQEYPMNAAEAFQVTGEDGLIRSDLVMKARKNKVNASGAYIVGVDPSRGGDRFAVMRRSGRKMYGKESYVGTQIDSLGKQVSVCKTILDTVCPISGKIPDMMFIDFGGGADLVDRLHELGYKSRVKAVKFGGTPLNQERYTNKRNEMWGLMLEWLSDENQDVEIPDDDEVQADFCASPYDRDSNGRCCLWRKEKIIKEYGFSPDFGDAGGLTFAEPVILNKKITPKGYSPMGVFFIPYIK